jgi:ABC-type sugar transport system ATPase subunit
MNVFAATLSADGARVSAPGFDAPVPAAFRAAAARSPGQGVLVGLRPEHIGPDAREAEVPVTLAGRVEIAETVGSEVIVHLRVGAERVLARYATRQVPKLGTPLELVGDGARLHLFDARDSRRLPEG